MGKSGGGKQRRRTKLKHRHPLTEFGCRRPSWRSFTEIGAGFDDLAVDDDVSSTP